MARAGFPSWRGACVAVLGIGALSLYAHFGGFGHLNGSPITVEAAPSLPLLDDSGKAFDVASLRGRAVLVYFGYVRCPDVCPTVLTALGPAFDHLGADASRVKVLFVTLDPLHDTPAVLHDFLSNFQPTPIGLTGTPGDIAAAARGWGVNWASAGPGGMINHNSILTLIGPDGRRRAVYGMTQINDSAALAADIRSVLSAS